ncbi:hypothetical protein [Paraburkholderia sp. GAS32]|uniref:hypothetical protein n=1 Tax=Paraburkholderia sp. GAS32 TaxID=3035129 RepID=UPI003D1BC435
MMETNEANCDDSRNGVQLNSGLGAPEKIALTTLILFFGVSAFVYIANHGAFIFWKGILAGFFKPD